MSDLSKKALTVSEAIDTRLTCRAFTDEKPGKETIIKMWML